MPFSFWWAGGVSRKRVGHISASTPPAPGRAHVASNPGIWAVNGQVHLQAITSRPVTCIRYLKRYIIFVLIPLICIVETQSWMSFLKIPKFVHRCSSHFIYIPKAPVEKNQIPKPLLLKVPVVQAFQRNSFPRGYNGHGFYFFRQACPILTHCSIILDLPCPSCLYHCLIVHRSQSPSSAASDGNCR